LGIFFEAPLVFGCFHYPEVSTDFHSCEVVERGGPGLVRWPARIAPGTTSRWAIPFTAASGAGIFNLAGHAMTAGSANSHIFFSKVAR
jgi:hypothetical protein